MRQNKWYVLAFAFMFAVAAVFVSCSNGDDSDVPVVPVGPVVDAISVNSELGANLNRDASSYPVSFTLPFSAFDDAMTFNKTLAQVSLVNSDRTGSKENITKFYQGMGFDNISARHTSAGDNYDENDVVDAISYCLAHRKIGEFDVVALAIRGVKYTAEWGNNLNIGKTGDHAGFLLVAEKVYAALKSYIDTNYASSYTGKKLKLWITGYSRGGGVANVLSYLILTDTAKKLAIDRNKVFVYTFEAPKGLIKEHTEAYGNVFNILSLADPVPYIAPVEYGFYRCGKDIVLFKGEESEYIRQEKIDRELEEYTRYNLSYTTVVDNYLQEFDPKIVLPSFCPHSLRKYKNPPKEEEDAVDYKTEKKMVSFLISTIMQKDGSAAGGISFKTRELYATTVQELALFLVNLYMTNADKFPAVIADLKGRVFDLLGWLASKDAFCKGVKATLVAASVNIGDEAKFDEMSAKLYDTIDMMNGGCLTPLLGKLMPKLIGESAGDFTRLVAMHYLESVHVLLTRYNPAQ